MKPASEPPDLFSRQRYEERRGEIRLHMSYFFLKYLTDIYQAFEGDLATTIILGEISHHNTARLFSPQHEANETMHRIQDDPALWRTMEGCNAYSISCATGIPRETVRRKVSVLKKKGWIEDDPGHGLRITKACAEHFGVDYTPRFLNGLLRASRKIEALLAGEEKRNPETKAASKPPIKSETSKAPSVGKPRTRTKSKKS